MLNKFIEWCAKNNINIYKNQEAFFISQRLVIKPDFKLANKTYIDLIRPEEINPVYLKGCEAFAKSFGTIIVIPTDIVGDMDQLTKEQIETKFNISL
jgi:hypothetical protein